MTHRTMALLDIGVRAMLTTAQTANPSVATVSAAANKTNSRTMNPNFVRV
ncbi:hypothetical protein [Diaminobutyricimonas sp. LJ205]|nr:hypothetical protein [Diaminobutyricimonas sp. LJ205]